MGAVAGVEQADAAHVGQQDRMGRDGMPKLVRADGAAARPRAGHGAAPRIAVEAAAGFVGRALAAGLLPASLELVDGRAGEAASRVVPGALLGGGFEAAGGAGAAVLVIAFKLIGLARRENRRKAGMSG